MKRLSLLIIMVFTLLFTACSSSKLSSINYNELKEKITAKESFVLYISTKDDTLEDTLNSVLENYQFSAYKINLDKLSDDEKLELKLKFSYEDPSLIFVIDGSDPTILSHVTDSNIRKNDLISRLKDMNFIKEEK